MTTDGDDPTPDTVGLTPDTVGPAAKPRSPYRVVRAWRRLGRNARGARQMASMRFDPTYRRMVEEFEFPDGTRRVYVHHVRKTAGTSLFLSFLALGGEDPTEVWRRMIAQSMPRAVSGGYVYASIHRQILAEGAYHFGRAHRPAAEQPLAAGTFSVTVLRDPVARVHSYFDYLIAGDTTDSPGSVSPRERRTAFDGFDAFLERVPPRHLLSQLHTFSTSLDVNEATDRIAGCSAVFFTEHFADGLSDLSDRLGLPLVQHRARVTETRSELTDAQTERLRTLLEPEYELFARLAAAGIAPAPPRA